MLDTAERLGQRFSITLFFGFLLTPLVGFGVARLSGVLKAHQLDSLLAQGLVPGISLILLFWALFHFQGYVTPFVQWVQRHPQGGVAPGFLHKRLSTFSYRFWGILALNALAPVPAAYLVLQQLGQPIDADATLHLGFMLVAAALLTGTPAYLSGLNQIGKIAGLIHLERVHVSLKTRAMVLTGLVPVTAYTLLADHQWLIEQRMDHASLILLSVLILLAVASAWLAGQGMQQALEPFRQLLIRSGASTHNDLSQLKPTSIDEIGHLTQTLGHVFRRLGDKETHMRTIVDTAAEAIIVVDAKGRVDTFNPAAERLFGYLAQEIRGRHLSMLLPDLFSARHTPMPHQHESEADAIHRNGSKIQVALRLSEMSISGNRMFTYLVGDITRRKAAERELIAAQTRYRDLVETAHDLVWSVDESGCWDYLNAACQLIYGLPPSELIGRPVTEFSAPDHAQQDSLVFACQRDCTDVYQYETVHLDTRGVRHSLSFNARVHLDAHGRITGISGTARDITEQKAFQKKLTYQAEHDSLTRLFNRDYFQQELQRTVSRVARNPHATCALFYIDIDQFKYINDTLGHAAGDRLLVQTTRVLKNHIREGDLLARFGGDEFTVLLYDINAGDAMQAADHFRRLFENCTFIEAGKNINVTCSVGVALIDAAVEDAEAALSHADIACNIAKSRGRNRSELYNPDHREKAGMAEDMGWAARVREMLELDRFQLVYQPILSLQDDSVTHYEVLVRMVCDDGEIILPGGFMPAAERFGLIHSVDRWIVRRALTRLKSLHQSGERISFSINLSGKAFEDVELLPLIRGLLDNNGIDPQQVCFEITETAAIANLAAAERFIAELKVIGCQFALDDFGSGFSSFAYLKHLPVDKLKIDGAFVQGLAHSSVDQAMVRSMNQVAHALGKQTIAEYVEDATTLRILRSLGLDYAQGNFIGKPREALLSTAGMHRLQLRPVEQSG